MKAFGHDFRVVGEHHFQELLTLERERAIYGDHWIPELNDFRHIRINFSEEEVEDYVRRVWAYEQFLRAGTQWARDVPGIDPQIANDADTYSSKLKDGTVIPPPYHCPAAFYGPHLESLVCSNMPGRYVVIDALGREAFLLTVRQVVDSLTPAIRSFNNREKGLAPWGITREDDVRDLMYAMLRPAVSDLRREEPIPSKAGTYKFSDLCTDLARTLIELKWISKRGSWKKILDEVHVDIQTYPRHPSCDNLVFVIVDTCRDIPDPRLIEEQLTGEQIIDGRKVHIAAYVREP
jgi:REase_DpnII-MboI